MSNFVGKFDGDLGKDRTCNTGKLVKNTHKPCNAQKVANLDTLFLTSVNLESIPPACLILVNKKEPNRKAHTNTKPDKTSFLNSSSQIMISIS
jgi:hypothetical protein